jgi:hypothetical protein
MTKIELLPVPIKEPLDQIPTAPSSPKGTGPMTACATCYEESHLSEMVKIEGCKHVEIFDKECLGEYLTNKIKNGEVQKISCCQHGCPEFYSDQ